MGLKTDISTEIMRAESDLSAEWEIVPALELMSALPDIKARNSVGYMLI